MRTFFTSFMAFFLSMFAGSIVAQILAEATNATEEYILVFLAVVVLAIVLTLAFFVAQFLSDARRAVNVTAKWSFLLFAVLVLALAGFEVWEIAGDMAKLGRDLPILAGLVLPGIAIILVQWLFVRWRLGKTPASFGRDGQPA
jgi:hypothetical protein